MNNPENAPIDVNEQREWLLEHKRVTDSSWSELGALTGIPSGTITPGGAPTEVDVTLCNNSAVDRPEVGVVVVLGHCSCAPNPMSIPVGTVERFDNATDSWIPLEHPTAGTGMDYLAGFSNVQDLPTGTTATLRYRIALDASMTAGDGAVEAVAVTPATLDQLGSADLAFTVAA
jgi:hypothetical protein